MGAARVSGVPVGSVVSGDLAWAGFVVTFQITQHGLSDTLKDLVFDTIGGIVVGLWGTVYLVDVSEAIRERLETGEG
jgi:VanZ family protein